MRFAISAFVLAAFVIVPCAAAEPARVHFLYFPKSDIESLGQIDKLNVTVDCSWIVGLRNVPELYNVEMGYEIPTQNLLEAEPRLGAAAVALSQWNGVIGVRIPPDADAKSCFDVTVTAEGRSGVTRTWKKRQLGFPSDT
jgi:hypothetical protein